VATLRYCHEKNANYIKMKVIRNKFFKLSLILVLIYGLSHGIWHYNLWHYFLFRHQPDNLQTLLFNNIHYFREVTQTPRRIVAHILKIDLRDEHLTFFITPNEKIVAVGSV